MRIRPVETSGLPIPFQRRGQGPVIVGSPDPLAWANKADGAKHAWDFIANAARWNGQYIGALANTPNWTFTRASTAYYRNSSGLLTSVASGVLRTGDRGALIEGAGTNLCLQSQTFDNASWSKTNCTVTANQAVAPDGTATADLITVATTAATSMTGAAVSISGTNAVASIYVKNGNRSETTTSFLLYDTTAGATIVTAVVNWAAMTVSGTGASIETLANGWYRIILATAAWTSGNSGRIYGGATGGSLAAGLTWYLWGAQLEAKAYASSYIPTTTASATRAADSLTVTGVSGLDYPLTLYAEWESAVDTAASRGVFWAGVSDSNRTYLRLASNRTVRAVMTAGGAEQGAENPGVTTAVGSVYKQAGRSNTDDIKAAISGTLSAGDTTATKPSAPTKFCFGNIEVGTEPFYGYLRRLALFSRALSDAELTALTS